MCMRYGGVILNTGGGGGETMLATVEGYDDYSGANFKADFLS